MGGRKAVQEMGRLGPGASGPAPDRVCPEEARTGGAAAQPCPEGGSAEPPLARDTCPLAARALLPRLLYLA